MLASLEFVIIFGFLYVYGAVCLGSTYSSQLHRIFAGVLAVLADDFLIGKQNAIEEKNFPCLRLAGNAYCSGSFLRLHINRVGQGLPDG